MRRVLAADATYLKRSLSSASFPAPARSRFSVERHKGTGLTLSDLNSCMNDLFRTMYPNTKAVTKAENVVSLAAPGFKFKGNCNYCKKPDHLARDCRKKMANAGNNEGKSTHTLRPCKRCGGQHMDSKRWEMPTDVQRPGKRRR
jgi:hypothetical protein